MSLYGALFGGVSSLQAQAGKISTISNNIANVNTVGYKGAEGLFENLVTSAGIGNGGGVIGASRQLVDQQGLLQSTDSSTDIAISGGGFFVVNDSATNSGEVFYTRVGSFTQDSLGNFRNAAGYFLQAWPLDRNGLLPGEPGNSNTTSSANLSSLTTVNVQNLTGTASATTSVGIGANLKSTQSAYLGAGFTATLDRSDTANYGTGGLTAKGIIVPSTTDSLTEGDSFTVTTSSGVNSTFTYGGFTRSRNVTNGTGAGDSSGALGNGQATLVNTPINVTAGNIDVVNGDNTVTLTVASTANLRVGDWVTVSGLTTDFGGYTVATDINGLRQITNIPNGTTFEFEAAAPAGSNGTSAEGAVATPNPIKTTSADPDVYITQHDHGLQSGDTIVLSGVTGGVGGFTLGDFNSTDGYVVTVIDDDHFTITMADDAGSTAGGGTGTIISDSRLFTGRILNASLATDKFLGSLATSDFTAAGLTFTISTSTDSHTFSYVSGTPNTALGQFNTLNNLATAINAQTDLSARVVNNQLFVGAVDANDLVTFENGSEIGVQGPPVQRGIDWIGELGLDDVATASGGRFNSLQSLASVINDVDGLTSTVVNPNGGSSITIHTSDPLASITIADTALGGGGNTGSVLAALGIVDSLEGGSPVAGTDTEAASYDPSDNTKNMASGSITAQFSRPIQIYDALGTTHNLTIGFIKTGVNTWAAEVYIQPADEVTTSGNDGQIAFGTMTFNGDGTLASIDSALTQALNITWNPSTNGADPSSITVDWGTAGPVGTGQSDGLGQFASDYRVGFVNQNGAPVGQLTGVSISDDGTITASFSNGETQALYKIPLAQFSDVNELQQSSAGVFSQTQSSGTVNLAQAGAGGAGGIVANSLEASNVDLADQLTDMIVAQRSYQAASKVITIADQLLDDLNRAIQ
ncbi:MAG: flagellar hook-basal body complex protein [Rickettsiales bacterium]|nr:flagellar hook-basal body complex protein [Rickettsiales bacterium]